MSDDKSWGKVNEMQRDIAAAFAQAKAAYEYERVGHLRRQTLIALADTVHDPVRHPPTDDVIPSKTDAKRRLEAFFAAELRGSSNEAARRAAKAAVDLANAVLHGEDKMPREAALAVIATTAVIDFTAIVAGHREKPVQSIQVELAERLARAKADAASWQAKYEGLAGFSAQLSIVDHGAQYLCMKATQDVEVSGVDYCLGDGVCIVPDDSPGALRGTFRKGLDGRDVRVPINHSYVEATFWRSTWGIDKRQSAGRLEVLTIILRVRFRVGEVYMERERKARVEHEVGSSVVRLVGG